MRPISLCLLALLPIFGCAQTPRPVAVHSLSSWQKDIGDEDRKRLNGLWNSWARAIGEVRAAGEGAQLAAQGALLNPEAALPSAMPRPGRYSCRTVKLGGDAARGVRVAEPVPCAIEPTASGLRFSQGSGAQRLAGRLYPDGDRLVFLGSLRLAMDQGAMPYGADSDRDQIGVIRPYAPGRWRLELPWPRWEATLVVVDITPA